MPASREVTLQQFADEMSRKASGAMSFRVPLKQAQVATKADVKSNFDAGHSPDGVVWAPLRHQRVRAGNGNPKPLRDRGILMSSIVGRGRGHIETLTDVEMTVGTNLDYAQLQQEGGTVTPTGGRKYLAIPLTIQAFRAGSPRSMPGLSFVFGKRGGVAIERKGKGKRMREIVHFALTKSVTIPARPFLGFSKKLLATIDEIFVRFMEKQAGG